MCAGVSYSRVTHVCSQIANAVQENIKIYGVFLPPGIVTGRAIRAATDYVDKQVDTHDGKNSFHAMASSVFKPTCPRAGGAKRRARVLIPPGYLHPGKRKHWGSLKFIKYRGRGSLCVGGHPH